MQIPPELCQLAQIPEDMEVKVDKQAIVRAGTKTRMIGKIILPYTNRENDSQRWVGIWDTPAGMVTEFPCAVINSFGKGQSCYISARVHSLNPVFSPIEGRELMFTFARSLIDALPYEIEAPSWVVSTAYRHLFGKRILMHLVNAPKDTPVTPLENIKVLLRINENENVQIVLLYPDGARLDFTQNGCNITFLIPTLDLYQIIKN